MNDNQQPPPYDELLVFLPQLEKLGPDDIYVDHWSDHEAKVDENGQSFIQLDYQYHPVIDRFFHRLSDECWMDWSYDIGEAGQLAGDDEALKRATLAELKWVMTWMSRGERFCLEHHGACVDSGLVVAVLRRLQELKEEEVG